MKGAVESNDIAHQKGIFSFILGKTPRFPKVNLNTLIHIVNGEKSYSNADYEKCLKIY